MELISPEAMASEFGSGDEESGISQNNNATVAVVHRHEDAASEGEVTEKDNDTEIDQREFSGTEASDDESEVRSRSTDSTSSISDSEVEMDCSPSPPPQKKRKSKTKRKKRSKHSHADEDREDQIVNKAVERLQWLMTQGDYGNNGGNAVAMETPRSHRGKGNFDILVTSPSEATIYRNAIQLAKRKSSSSEGGNDMSGDLMEAIDRVNNLHDLIDPDRDNSVEPFSVGYRDDGRDEYHDRDRREDLHDRGCSRDHDRDRGGRGRRHRDEFSQERRREPTPLTFGANHHDYGQSRDNGGPQDVIRDAERRAEDLIREAEASKARMADVPGKHGRGISKLNTLPINDEFVHSMLVDQNFLMVAAHVDEGLHRKIIMGEYVDFAKLLPRDKVTVEEDHHMELVNCDGQACYMPIADQEALNNPISSFNKWEQAFRVFTDIYTREFPNCSAELIQYNHVIHTAALTYSWDNVCRYDRQFRVHMSNHPTRSWSIILQQAWSMTLKDKHGNTAQMSGKDQRSKGGNSKRDLCY